MERSDVHRDDDGNKMMMRYSIGIDMGGTKIEGVLMSEKGKVLYRYRIPTEVNKGRKKVLHNLTSLIDDMKSRHPNKKLHGIGVGIPGFADDKGRIVNMPNAPLLNFNLASFLKRKYRCSVVVENDANCFALAEYAFGAGKGSKVMFGLITGTGVGGGIIIDGKVFSGSEGGAGEIGHLLLDRSAKKLNVNGNDFESFCSGPSLAKRFIKAGGDKKKCLASDIIKSKTRIAKTVMDDEYRYLGMMLGDMVTLMNPDLIVLGGGVSNSLSPKLLEKELRNYTLPFSGRKVKVRHHKLGDSSGVRGAAALVFKH